MCGLIASYNYGGGAPVVDEQTFERARDTMRTRGPDAAGYWCSDDGRVVFGHRRLAIIDLDASANQPMQLQGRAIWIVFNGEIYNFRELRRELEANGTRFRTNSDTEVILQLYEQRGTRGVELLRGMFAFAIWDGRDHSILLARDPLGIKPIYYYDDGERLLAASQIRAIRSLSCNLTPDPVGHLGFFLDGYVPEPHTMFSEIRVLPAGCWLRRSSNKLQLERFYSVKNVAVQGAAEALEHVNIRDRGPRIAEALRSSVDAHMVADVEVGIFLSAGVDSAAIGWLAGKHSIDQLRSITLGAYIYKGKEIDEVPSAAELAATIGLAHKGHYMDGEEFTDQIQNIIGAMDQPSIDGVNTYFVSKIAAESDLKVVLSGLGGDELFRGYPSFRHVPNMVRINRPLNYMPWAGRVVRSAVAPFVGRLSSPKYASLFEYGGTYGAAYFLRRALYLPWELTSTCDQSVVTSAFNEFAAETFSDRALEGVAPEARVAVLELTRYMRDQLLRDSDWAAMAWSLEFRVPLVDSVLLTELAPYLFSRQGITKREMLAAISHPLEEKLGNRAKTGFAIPIREWIKELSGETGRGLRGWAQQVYVQWCKENGCPVIIEVVKK